MPNRQRFTRPLRGTLDANGNGTLKVTPPPSAGFWSVLTLAGSAKGTPNWDIFFNGNLLQSGSGPTVVLSLHPLGPGETIDIVLTNGSQNTEWTATLLGTLTDSEQDAMSLYQPSSMSSSSSTAVQAPIVALKQTPGDSGIYTINDLAPHTFTFALPPNTQGIRWKWRSTSGATFTQMNLVGNVSGVLNPYNGASFDGQTVGASNQQDQFFIIEATDTAIIVNVDLAAGDVSFELDAYVSPTVVAAQLVGTIGVVDGFAIVTRTSLSALPAPWQAPRSSSLLGLVIGPGATAVIVPGVVGQFVWLFPTSLSIDVAVATGALSLADTTGVGIHQFNLGAIIMNPFLASGLKLSASGRGLQLTNLTGGAITIRGSVPYTQAA